MKKAIKISILIVAIISIFILASKTTFAKDYSCPKNLSSQKCILWGIEQSGGEAGFDTSIVGESVSWSDSAISEKIGQIISYVLAFLGILFLIISITSGLQWMTAGGSEEKITQARSRLLNATIGLIIVIMAYAITWFVVSKLQNSVNPQTPIQDPSFECNAQNCLPICAPLNKTFIDCTDNVCNCGN